jgi:glycerol-3-phosphate acyltransferase PlsY
VLAALLIFVAAFLIGSIPFGIVVGRLFFGSDLRQAGSGNIGAANALRSYGTWGGIAVLVLDALKGFVPVAFAFRFDLWPPAHAAAPALAALGAVLGHCFSPWLRLRGGKGVATWLGALFALSWIGGIAFVVVWLLIVLPTRFASLGSIVASIASVFFVWYLARDLTTTVAASLVALVILWKHRENVARLRAGTENRIGLRRA